MPGPAAVTISPWGRGGRGRRGMLSTAASFSWRYRTAQPGVRAGNGTAPAGEVLGRREGEQWRIWLRGARSPVTMGR